GAKAGVGGGGWEEGGRGGGWGGGGRGAGVLVGGGGWVVGAGGAGSPGPAEGGDVAEIRAMLEAQDAAWNKGDLDGFMKGYWNDPELTFYTERPVDKGYEALRERYRTKYQAGGKDLGKLTFSDLDVRRTG